MMNGSSSVSVAQSARIKSEPDDWTKEDCLMLLERIRTLLPDTDAMKYKTTESHFDWDKVGFAGFTGEMCRQKWQKVSSDVRKYRTMTELIVDATEFVKNPYKGKKLKVSPSDGRRVHMSLRRQSGPYVPQTAGGSICPSDGRRVHMSL
ncbi:nucleolar transcription factor 1-B-like [Etheostoma cragini]|uniref:nucleolar transcription factor 1-B-like n=1 Tax=Etheostoma cragini TaxID=417921 RepID=UPI00155F0605|nr:nucleolar transcription factor 1-B-like [Etheostoma cragini]XP_034721403.1 nucleolar transcription factor 1-B-like [Etheostoma cragini]